MGDRLDLVDLMDEGGWPYADQAAGMTAPEPIDLRSDADDDMVALHALRRGSSPVCPTTSATPSSPGSGWVAPRRCR